MYACVYVCMCAYVYICLSLCILVFMYVGMYVCTQVGRKVCVYVMYGCLYVCMFVYNHVPYELTFCEQMKTLEDDFLNFEQFVCPGGCPIPKDYMDGSIWPGFLVLWDGLL